MRVLADHSCSWVNFVAQKLQQSRLSSTIGSNKSKASIQIDTELQILVNIRSCLVVSKADVLDLKEEEMKSMEGLKTVKEILP